MLIDTLNKIIDYANQIPYVHSAYKGNPYDIWNTGEIKYGSFCIIIESCTKDQITTYNIIAYYADRLLQDKSNLFDIQCDAERVLTSIINSLEEEIGEIGPYTIEFFEQQFADYLAGGYARFSLIPDQSICYNFN